MYFKIQGITHLVYTYFSLIVKPLILPLEITLKSVPGINQY